MMELKSSRAQGNSVAQQPLNRTMMELKSDIEDPCRLKIDPLIVP